MQQRREFPKAVRVAAYQRADGYCETCTAPLATGHIIYDHKLPDALGGEPTLENCQVICSTCDDLKTDKHDIPQIAKMKRQRATHIGAKPPSKRPLPGGRNSIWKTKIGGGTVRRDA